MTGMPRIEGPREPPGYRGTPWVSVVGNEGARVAGRRTKRTLHRDRGTLSGAHAAAPPEIGQLRGPFVQPTSLPWANGWWPTPANRPYDSP
jgi:hypothetical protein